MAAFSDIVMHHFLHPRGTGPMPSPTGEGWAGSLETSRTMRIQVRVADGQVLDARFATYGCAPAIAAGNWLCEWVMGRPVAEAQAMSADRLNDELGGLPESRRFCANLAVDALHHALSKALANTQNHEVRTP